jgi:Family of unknown function (DUF5675)
MTEERLKIWLGFGKFLLGTFAIGLVTTLVNSAIQEREVEIKEQEQVGHFLQHALQEDVGVRRRFAQYFATVTRSDQLRKGWASYFKLIETEYQEKRKEKTELEARAQNATIDAQERERLSARIAELERALSPRPAVTSSPGAAEILALKLVRKTLSPQSTFGELYVNDVFECYTLENPISPGEAATKPAIPKGSYEVVLTLSPRFNRRLPLILGVPNIEGARIHSANTPKDLLGESIAIGRARFGDGIGQSRAALEQLMGKLEKAGGRMVLSIEIET